MLIDGPASLPGFVPCVCLWLATCFLVCRHVGERNKWTIVQILQLHRSIQCGILAGVGLFTMGVFYGQGQSLSGQCSGNSFVAGIIHFFLWYFLADLCIMLSIGHLRSDLLMHHGVALAGIVSLILFDLYPCASSSVAATELISLFSGIESMLPKPATRSNAEWHVFYVIRSYRLAVLVLIRPFLWQHVRQSASAATSPLQAANYLIPGTCLQMLDILWSYKICKSLFPGVFATLFPSKEDKQVAKGDQSQVLKATS